MVEALHRRLKTGEGTLQVLLRKSTRAPGETDIGEKDATLEFILRLVGFVFSIKLRIFVETSGVYNSLIPIP